MVVTTSRYAVAQKYTLIENRATTYPTATAYPGGVCSQKAAFVSPLISWLPTLQPQRTPIEH